MKFLSVLALTVFTLQVHAHGFGTPTLSQQSTTTSFQFVDMFTSSNVAFKEEIRNVEADAYDFLAGDPKTRALDAVIQKLREEIEGFAESSDEQIVTEMLKSN